MKLTDEQREQAKRELQAKFEVAIGESPRGLTLEETQTCFTLACSSAIFPSPKVEE